MLLKENYKKNTCRLFSTDHFHKQVGNGTRNLFHSIIFMYFDNFVVLILHLSSILLIRV